MLRIEIYPDASGAWRWRAVDGNYRIIADGSEGYMTREGVERALDNVMNEFRGDVRIVAKKGTAFKTLNKDANPDPFGHHQELAQYQPEGQKS